MIVEGATTRTDIASVLGWAKVYATAFRGIPRLVALHRPRICPFERLIDAVPERSRVLDVGCGNGMFLYLLARAGRLEEGAGVDMSRDSVSRGSRALANLRIDRVSLQVADAPDAWPRRPFDVVSMIDVMHHVPPHRQRDLLAAACALVRPGGLLIYKDIATTPAWTAWANRLHDLILAREWIHYLGIGEVEASAVTAGLHIQQAESIRRAWYAHELRVFRRANP